MAKIVDWDAMEPEWRAGIKSPNQLAKEYGVSRPAILKHFDKKGVKRDLAAKIRARAESLVTEDAVTSPVAPETKIAENAVVEANAQLQASIIRDQRGDIKEARELVRRLLSELRVESLDAGLLEEMAEFIATDKTSLIGDAGKRDAAFRKMMDGFMRLIDLPSRATVMQKLTESLIRLVDAERRVFGIKDDVPPDPISNHSDEEIESRIAHLAGKAGLAGAA
jgi:hypothetical protein